MTQTPSTPLYQPLPRCCPSHADWPTLVDHLLADFARLTAADVVRELRSAREAVQSVALEEADAIDTAELIARYQLMLLAGQIDDVARLDPETHVRMATPRY